MRKQLIIKIKVEPRSSRAGIVGSYGESLKVKITSPPVEGKANRELIEILAKELKIAKRDIEIISGKSSRNKIIKLQGVTNLDNLIKKQESLKPQKRS